MTKEAKIAFVKRNHETMSYPQMAKPLGYKNGESVRKFCRVNGLTKGALKGMSFENLPLKEKVKNFIAGKQRDIGEICNKFNVAPKTIIKVINELKAENVLVDNFENKFRLGNAIDKVKKPFKIDIHQYKEKEYCFGAVADSHIGSKYERNDVLEALYDRFAEAGVKKVFHGGNWIDGEARFNKFDIYAYGIEAQIANFIEKYPYRKGIETHIISGDDHEGWYVQREHINIGKLMETEARAAGRTDLIDLGYMERDIELVAKKGKAILRVIHAGGGSSYAISYTSQKYAESLQGGEKPNIVIVGHYHKFDYSYPREIHMIQPGCTEDQTPFMRKRKLQAMVGGCILWIKQNELGVITSLKIEWIPFYSKKHYEYKWR